MYIAIDIGGTNTRILMTEDLNNPNFKNVVYVLTEQLYGSGLQNIFYVIGNVVPKAIAIGFAGGVNPNTLNVDGSNALPDWHDKSLGNNFKQRYSCPVFAYNDAVMGAYGEAYYGMEIRKDFIYLTWGTGLGSAIVEWNTDEVKVFRPKDRSSLYKSEEFVGGSYCEEKYGKAMEDLSSLEWNEVVKNLKREIISLSKDPNWNKSTFVLGGGITTKQLDRLQKLTNETEVTIFLSRLGDNSGLYGGLTVIKNNQ